VVAIRASSTGAPSWQKVTAFVALARVRPIQQFHLVSPCGRDGVPVQTFIVRPELKNEICTGFGLFEYQIADDNVSLIASSSVPILQVATRWGIDLLNRRIERIWLALRRPTPKLQLYRRFRMRRFSRSDMSPKFSVALLSGIGLISS
jgi:hypothetical protein